MNNSIQKKPNSEQKSSILPLSYYDTAELTEKNPIMPTGYLFEYYPKSRAETLHYHNFLEIGYSDYGAGVFIIDGKITPYAGKVCSIIYPGSIHIAQSSEENKSLWHFLYIDLNMLMKSVGSPPTRELKAMNHTLYEFPNVLKYEDCQDMYDLIKAILYEASNARSMYLNSVMGLVYSLLIKHSRFMKSVKTTISNRTELLDELGETMNYINAHYYENIDLKTLTAISNMSKSTLRRKITEFTGLPPMQYVQNLRLNRASVLLATSSMPVAGIAMDVGYNSISVFNKQFRAYFGISPTKYKKQGMKPSSKP